MGITEALEREATDVWHAIHKERHATDADQQNALDADLYLASTDLDSTDLDALSAELYADGSGL